MKKRWIAMVFLVTLVVGVASLLMMDAAPGVTADGFRRIRPGMHLERVEAILGRPCDASPVPGIQAWKGDGVEFRIFFDPEGQVAGGAMQTRDDGGDTVETLHSGFSLREIIRSVIRW
jgi:hypothetical protein